MKYTEEELEEMIKSEDCDIRAEVAKQGYGLERLIFDENYKVRIIALDKLTELVEQGKAKITVEIFE